MKSVRAQSGLKLVLHFSLFLFLVLSSSFYNLNSRTLTSSLKLPSPRMEVRSTLEYSVTRMSRRM